MQAEGGRIDLSVPLSLRTSFRFPLQSAVARREVFVGALWLLVPGVGWILNMGHRIVVVHHMLQGRPAWPGWRNYSELALHGGTTLLGMLFYYLPALTLGVLGMYLNSLCFVLGGGILAVGATIAIPGFMSHYCRELDPREIFNPWRALRRCFSAGRGYWHAWGIALAALGASFVGLAFVGVGFLLTSVWFWQVAGFSFASVMTQNFELDKDRRTNK